MVDAATQLDKDKHRVTPLRPIAQLLFKSPNG